MLALAPSDGPLYRGRLLRALAAFAVPAGLATAIGSILSFFLVDTVAGASLEAGRTAATTTLIVLGLSFVLLLERGPGREHIAIQSYMLALVAGLGALYALILAAAPIREFFEMELLTATQWFLALLSAAVGLTIASVLWRLPQIERLEAPPEVAGRGRLTEPWVLLPLSRPRRLIFDSGPCRDPSAAGSFDRWRRPLDPARPSPGAGKYPLDPGRFDEAFAPGGTPRPPYAAVLDALARHDLIAAARARPLQSPAGGSTNWVTMRLAASFGSPPSLIRSIRTSITTVVRPT